MVTAAPRQRVVVTRIGDLIHPPGQMRAAYKPRLSPTPAVPGGVRHGGSSSRVPPASASTPLPTPCTPLALHNRSKPTMADVEVDPEMAVGAQPKKRTFLKFSYRGVLDVLLDMSMDDLV